MKKKLTIEHLAPYLPYELPIQYEYKVDKNKYTGLLIAKGFEKADKIYDLIIFAGQTLHINYCKPILHPISDLIKEIEINGEKFIPIEKLASILNGNINIKDKRIVGKAKRALINEINIGKVQFRIIKKLFEWHFDVFGLIENNLAIDINTL